MDAGSLFLGRAILNQGHPEWPLTGGARGVARSRVVEIYLPTTGTEAQALSAPAIPPVAAVRGRAGLAFGIADQIHMITARRLSGDGYMKNDPAAVRPP